MTLDALPWLFATASFAFVGSIGVSIAILLGNRCWGLRLARFGIMCGSVFGVVLATLLSLRSDPIKSIQSPLWNWLSFPSSQLPSIDFGLESTLIKAALIGFAGLLAFIAMWNANSVSRHQMSDDSILTTSWLYTAGTVFAFAPNLPQALLGWGGLGLCTVILMRLSRQQTDSEPSELRMTSLTFEGQQYSSPWNETLRYAVEFLERFSIQGWSQLSERFPNWLAVQTELTQSAPVPIQLLAAILGMSAILLTWLM